MGGGVGINTILLGGGGVGINTILWGGGGRDIYNTMSDYTYLVEHL